MSVALHFTAGEPSGDLLGREVIGAVRARVPDAAITGIGGAEMAAAGVFSPFDVSRLAVLGYWEGLKAYPRVLDLADRAADHIVETRPDAAILIDSWGFTIRVADRVRRRDPTIRLVKLVGPQVWATRPGRAGKLATRVDQLLCIHEMERPFYESLPLDAEVIGNPALSRTAPGDGAAFRARHGLRADTPLLAVFPGSRPSEIANVAPVLMRAAERLKAERPGLAVFACPAQGVAGDFRSRFPGANAWYRLADPDDGRHHAMAAADLALACSGTVTSEIALQETPMIVGYRIGLITYLLVRHLLYRHRHITLINIAAGDREIVPEFVQDRFNVHDITMAAGKLLDDAAARACQVASQSEALKAMGQGGRPSAERAAEAILAGLGRRLPPG